MKHWPTLWFILCLGDNQPLTHQTGYQEAVTHFITCSVIKTLKLHSTENSDLLSCDLKLWLQRTLVWLKWLTQACLFNNGCLLLHEGFLKADDKKKQRSEDNVGMVSTLGEWRIMFFFSVNPVPLFGLHI